MSDSKLDFNNGAIKSVLGSNVNAASELKELLNDFTDFLTNANHPYRSLNRAKNMLVLSLGKNEDGQLCFQYDIHLNQSELQSIMDEFEGDILNNAVYRVVQDLAHKGNHVAYWNQNLRNNPYFFKSEEPEQLNWSDVEKSVFDCGIDLQNIIAPYRDEHASLEEMASFFLQTKGLDVGPVSPEFAAWLNEVLLQPADEQGDILINTLDMVVQGDYENDLSVIYFNVPNVQMKMMNEPVQVVMSSVSGYEIKNNLMSNQNVYYDLVDLLSTDLSIFADDNEQVNVVELMYRRNSLLKEMLNKDKRNELDNGVIEFAVANGITLEQLADFNEWCINYENNHNIQKGVNAIKRLHEEFPQGEASIISYTARSTIGNVIALNAIRDLSVLYHNGRTKQFNGSVDDRCLEHNSIKSFDWTEVVNDNLIKSKLILNNTLATMVNPIDGIDGIAHEATAAIPLEHLQVDIAGRAGHRFQYLPSKAMTEQNEHLFMSVNILNKVEDYDNGITNDLNNRLQFMKYPEGMGARQLANPAVSFISDLNDDILDNIIENNNDYAQKLDEVISMKQPKKKSKMTLS